MFKTKIEQLFTGKLVFSLICSICCICSLALVDVAVADDVYGISDNEPNNSFDEAQALAEFEGGFIAGRDDVDYYTFELNNPSVFEFRVSPPDYQTKITFYNNEQMELFSVEQADDKDFNEIIQTLPEGQYYLSISALDGWSSSEAEKAYTYEYIIENAVNDVIEPNDYFKLATGISAPCSFTGWTSHENDVDIYSFTPEKDGVLTVALSRLDRDEDLYLYDNNQALLEMSEHAKCQDEEIVWAVTKGETYFIKVKPFESVDQTVNYTLDVQIRGLDNIIMLDTSKIGSVKVGQEFTIPIVAMNMNGLETVSVILEYNDEIIELLDVNSGEQLTEGYYEHEEGSLQINYTLPNGKNSVNVKNEVIANLKFKALKGGEAKLKFVECNIINQEAEVVVAIDGKVMIKVDAPSASGGGDDSSTQTQIKLNPDHEATTIYDGSYKLIGQLTGKNKGKVFVDGQEVEIFEANTKGEFEVQLNLRPGLNKIQVQVGEDKSNLLIIEYCLPVQGFTDVGEKHWAQHAIEKLVSYGVLKGYDDRSFKPTQNVTRSEFIKMLVTSLHIKECNEQALEYVDADAIQPWAEEYLQAAINAGIIKGYEDGSLKPNATITREEMMVMVLRAVNAQEVVKQASAQNLSYTDKAQISNYAKQYISYACNEGLINGYQDGSLRPQGQANRAEAAIIILKVLQNF